MVVRLSVAALTVLLAAGVVSAQQRVYIPAEIENGARVYQANCAVCHGADGDGVAGTNFGVGRIRRASSDDELVRIIIGGIPGTPMPPSNFSEGQAATIVAYLRSMATIATAAATADAGRGRTIFESKGQCLTCHSVNGNGARVGPSLTDIGAVRRMNEGIAENFTRCADFNRGHEFARLIPPFALRLIFVINKSSVWFDFLKRAFYANKMH